MMQCECRVFGTPETPIGIYMVPSEGVCTVYFNYGCYSMASRRRQVLHLV